MLLQTHGWSFSDLPTTAESSSGGGAATATSHHHHRAANGVNKNHHNSNNNRMTKSSDLDMEANSSRSSSGSNTTSTSKSGDEEEEEEESDLELEKLSEDPGMLSIVNSGADPDQKLDPDPDSINRVNRVRTVRYGTVRYRMDPKYCGFLNPYPDPRFCCPKLIIQNKFSC